jgi:hypothetical protein
MAAKNETAHARQRREGRKNTLDFWTSKKKTLRRAPHHDKMKK